MDYNELFEHMNLSKEARCALKNALVLRPQVNKTLKQIVITLKNPNYILPIFIEEVTQKLKVLLKGEFEVVVHFNIDDDLRHELTTQLLTSYIYFYNQEKNENISIIPIISKEKQIIWLNIQDNGKFNKLEESLISYGISNWTFVQGEQSDNVQLETNKVYINNETPSVTVTKSKFTNVDDYAFLNMDKLIINDCKVKVIGQVFSVETRSITSKKGNKFDLDIAIVTDFTDAIKIKRFTSEKTPKNISLPFVQGQIIAAYGKLKWDDYDNCNIFEPDYLEELDYNPFVLKDDYDGEKHIDLHVHTNRSEYDGVSATEELVKQAFKFGSKAIAITDTSVVQAYPLAQHAHVDIDKKNPGNDFKIIYGIDVKVVDDNLRIVHNATDQKIIDSEFAVIDFETTGLSTKYDHIIEFGGVIVRGGHVTNERLQLFVKPPVPIPAFIENKTNITNEMVKDALPIEQAIDKMLEFIGNRVIVAHNADFDFNFLNDTLVRIGRKPVRNICLDTLNMAKEVVKNRKYYKLGIIAKYYNIPYDEETAHRGDYDAEVLASVLIKMMEDMPDKDHITFKQLQENQDSDNFKKAHTYHTTLLAKNMAGIKNIYEIVSLSHTKYLTYFKKENAKKIDSEVAAEPRILKSEIDKRRANIIVGSCNQYSELFETACNRSDEELERVMSFYDYVEIQPLDNYSNLFEQGSSFNLERLKEVLANIIRVADKLGKLIVASNDVYYAHKYQKTARDIMIAAKRIGGQRHPLYFLNREKRLNYVAPDAHLMPTKELLNLFEYTSRAKEFVIDNPAKINNQIEKLYPIPTELATPEIPGCEDILKNVVYETAHSRYGDPLPEIVANRIDKELTNIITNGFSVQYYIAYLLVKQANEDGYPVGSRGSVGSSFIATMANITEVNPLVPHYVCPKCKHSEFFENNEVANGFDLPNKKCPVCGEEMLKDGHNIPFETFLGFNGDKVPDIDLNFAPDYQAKAQEQIKEIFGEDYSYRAGTIGTIAQKTAYGYVKGYCEEMEKPYYSKGFSDVLSMMCDGVKRTTGQHPGGIVVIPKDREVHDFSPIQYPANDPDSVWITTHYAFADLHDNILKLDILAHIDPLAIRLLSQFSGVHYKDVPVADEKVLSLLYSTEALEIPANDMYTETTGLAGIPELGTHNNRRILAKVKTSKFAQIVNIEGLTHGTDVWANNAEVWIDKGIANIDEVISCRDDIMTYLISKDMPKKMSFDIMEKVRKGKGLTPEWIEEMQKHDIPDWYIQSCQLIKYMFPKAHAVAYAMNAMRVAWYKVYRPLAYYAVYFSIRCDAYDIECMMAGKEAIYNKLTEIQRKMADPRNNEISNKEASLEPVLEICLEMYLRGYHINNISLKKSQATYFSIDPDDDHGLIPSFTSIDGLGEAVAESIVAAREERDFLSKEDFLKRTSVNNTQLAFMEKLGVLENMTNEDQLSLFG